MDEGRNEGMIRWGCFPYVWCGEVVEDEWRAAFDVRLEGSARDVHQPSGAFERFPEGGIRS